MVYIMCKKHPKQHMHEMMYFTNKEKHKTGMFVCDICKIPFRYTFVSEEVKIEEV